MELKHVRCFVVLADQLHYGQAAHRLFLTQSALSKQIAALERELGVALFERSRRHVRLTEAGSLLLPEAERMIALSERMATTAHQVRDGSAGTLRLGYSGAVSAGVLTDVLRRYHGDHPEVTFHVRESASHAGLLTDVADRVLDAAFFRYGTATSGFAITEVSREHTVVAAYDGHPFAERSSVRFAELRDEPLVMLSRDVDPEVFDHAIQLCSDAGFRPRIVHDSDSAQTSLALVAAGLGLAVVPSSALPASRPNVKAVALDDPSSLRVWLAHRVDDASPTVLGLVAAAETCNKLGSAYEDLLRVCANGH